MLRLKHSPRSLPNKQHSISIISSSVVRWLNTHNCDKQQQHKYMFSFFALFHLSRFAVYYKKKSKKPSLIVRRDYHLSRRRGISHPVERVAIKLTIPVFRVSQNIFIDDNTKYIRFEGNKKKHRHNRTKYLSSDSTRCVGLVQEFVPQELLHRRTDIYTYILRV